jgi:hypothetical protein
LEERTIATKKWTPFTIELERDQGGITLVDTPKVWLSVVAKYRRGGGTNTKERLLNVKRVASIRSTPYFGFWGSSVYLCDWAKSEGMTL